jgi:hypothetical protein
MWNVRIQGFLLANTVRALELEVCSHHHKTIFLCMDMVASIFFEEFDTAALPMFVLETLLSENKEMIGCMCRDQEPL